MKQVSIRALIVDDDVWSLRLMKGMLQTCFPDIEIVTRETPDISGGRFDLYFIDNEFHGEPHAEQLARQAREAAPNALVIGFSGTLNPELLKVLINAGCNGVCDKSEPSDLPRTMMIAQNYIQAVIKAESETGRGFVSALKSISRLLRDWNSRLDQQVSVES